MIKMDKRQCVLMEMLVVDAIGDAQWAQEEMNQQVNDTGEGYHVPGQEWDMAIRKIRENVSRLVDECGLPEKIKEYAFSLNQYENLRYHEHGKPGGMSTVLDDLDATLGKLWNAEKY